MTTSVTSPADVVNLALVRIGHTWRVGNLYDGSKGASLALDIYGQTRDQLIRDGQWGFARRDIALTLQKSAPAGGYFPPNLWSRAANPPPNWLYQYAYPDDCLKVRSVRPAPTFSPSFDPQPHVFDTPNDPTLTPPVKVLVCNVPNALCTYAGRITDPSQWEASFTEALAAELGRRLAPALANLDTAKLEASDDQIENAVADMTQG